MSVAWRDRIRQADVGAIRRIVTETGVFNAEEIDVAVELAEDRLKCGLDSDYHFVFADGEGEMLGYTCYGRIPFTDGRFDLYWIATAQGAQGRGLAAQLLAVTEAAVRGQGGKKLYAETSSRDVYLPAQRFYERHGFICEATLVDFYRAGDSKLTFVKSL